MSKDCVICGTEESEGELLLQAPCGRHWVCADDVGSFFENATNNESLFPPQCCGDMFMLEDYEDYVPFETAWAYQMKQQGEYSILAKFRTYCASSPCGKFLHPTSHVEDPETKITYAICEAEECGKLTCVKCRALLDDGTKNHECQQSEDERKFKQTANEKGYQECFVCGATVELAEACNHITCECGNAFCYICGENWPGLHGCPHYGPAIYDEEGYNQDGYHRDSGLTREGFTRRQEMIRRREQDDDDDDDDEEGEDDDELGGDREWEVMQHLTPDQRAMVNHLPPGPREDALDQFRITLFETQGITFDQFSRPPPPGEFGDGDTFEDDDHEDLEDAQGDDPGFAHGPPGPIPDQAVLGEAVEDLMYIDDELDQAGTIDGTEPSGDIASLVANQEQQQVPHNYQFTFTAGTDTENRLRPASLPTNGPYTIVARGFVSGTTIHDVEVVINRHGLQVIGRRLLGSDPLIVQLQFATQQEADNVIATFHGQQADGRVLDVRMEDEDL